MEVVNLPQDIFPGEKFGSEDIIIHEFVAHRGSFKGKSILYGNAVSLVLQGEKTMLFAERSLRIKDDEFHILSAGNCLASVDLSRQEIFRSILIFFPDKLLADFYVKYDELIRHHNEKLRVKAEPYVSLRKDAFVKTYIASLQSMLQQSQPVSQDMKRLKWEELFLYLLEHYPERILSFQPHAKNNGAQLELRKAVETNITNNLTVEELAFLCNMSVSTFKRRFRNIYGTSPTKWLVRKKLEMAAGLLRNYRERPGEVFHKVGYESHSSFAQSFKQVFGKTPSQYQEQFSNDAV
jgi:AraC-like DNA-binding protein